MDEYRISARGLAEYALRSGSIDAGFRPQAALVEGTKAHQAVQRLYGEEDRKEVPLAGEAIVRDIRFVLDGRCDGLLQGERGPVIEEIKSTARPLAELPEGGEPVHWAQAIVYAYLYAAAENIASVGIRLTYVRTEGEQRRQFEREAGVEELARAVTGYCEALYPYARVVLDNAAERQATAKALPFPYEGYRPGQRRLAGAVYKTIAEGKNLFLKAPTGTGKTISALFPAVKAAGEGAVDRIFYLTARTTQRTVAEEAFARMAGCGLRLRSVTLTAKESICFQEKPDCRPDKCPYADGHYDRVNGALTDLLGSETAITRDAVEAYARKHTVCPFELSIDAAYAADAVICDYNYVFDPRVSLKRLFEEQKRRTAVLVDEAHQLEPRAREMYSAGLAKSMFLAIRRAFKGLDAGVSEAAKAVDGCMLAMRKAAAGETDARLPGLPEELAARVEAFAAAAEAALPGAARFGAEAAEQLADAYFAALAFLRIAELFDERYIAYTETEGAELRVRLYCLDPSHNLRTMGKGYRARIFFSATLSPLGYYVDMLGGGDDDYALNAPSPFTAEQWDARVVPLSTRYRDREAAYRPIAELLAQAATAARAGGMGGAVPEVRERYEEGHERLPMAARAGGAPVNMLVFFPSYAFMRAVHGEFAKMGVDADVLVQEAGMTDEERAAFLRAFEGGRTRALVGFAVMGGIFGEGIDLQGDRLTAVAVVGVGLPQPSAEREWIRAYFDGTGKDGYDYAYVYPGMNKVLQAGGRLIRSESDRGTLLLIDDRYLQPKYRRLLPAEWGV